MDKTEATPEEHDLREHLFIEFEMNRSPMNLKMRLELRGCACRTDACKCEHPIEDLKIKLDEYLDIHPEVQIVDLSSFKGSSKEMARVVAPLVVRPALEKVVVANDIVAELKNRVKGHLLQRLSQENEWFPNAMIFAQEVNLRPFLNFQMFLGKITPHIEYTRKREGVVSGDDMKRPKLYAFRMREVHSPMSDPGTTADSDPDESTARRSSMSRMRSSNVDPKQNRCYSCHQKFKPVLNKEAYAHYKGRMCSPCSELNYKARKMSCNLSGKFAIVTGGRIKIGFEIVLKLLRDGCRVVATTRFIVDAEKRYKEEPDYDAWKDRLTFYQLELRDLKAIYAFTNWCKDTLPALDILINNAAQTIDRPAEFYRHLTAGKPPQNLSIQEDEQSTSSTDNDSAHPKVNNSFTTLKNASLKAVPSKEYPQHSTTKQFQNLSSYFPAGCYDADGQQIDLRTRNSWIAELSDVPIRELLTVYAVNAAAPFILVQELHHHMLASHPGQRKFIVNVSAMEGQFSRLSKTHRHPQTNMAKAALNMFTRTTGLELQPKGIYMTAVDTGWVTDERPFSQAEHEKTAKGFEVPLDAVDGACRVYHPIVEGFTKSKTPDFAVFLKNYKLHQW